jgi:hypothetical protein
MDDDDSVKSKVPAAFVRIVRTGDSTMVAVPDEWSQAPIGEMFNKPVKEPQPPKYTRKLVEVMD